MCGVWWEGEDISHVWWEGKGEGSHVWWGGKVAMCGGEGR